MRWVLRAAWLLTAAAVPPKAPTVLPSQSLRPVRQPTCCTHNRDTSERPAGEKDGRRCRCRPTAQGCAAAAAEAGGCRIAFSCAHR